MVTEIQTPKRPSYLGASIRGALSLGVAAALGGALLGAAAIGGGWMLGLMGSTAATVPLLGMSITNIGSALLGGAALGALGGVAAGVPAGVVAGPLRLRQMETEAAIPVIVEQSVKHGILLERQNQQLMAQNLDGETTKYRDMVAQQRAQQPVQHTVG